MWSKTDHWSTNRVEHHRSVQCYPYAPPGWWKPDPAYLVRPPRLPLSRLYEPAKQSLPTNASQARIQAWALNNIQKHSRCYQWTWWTWKNYLEKLSNCTVILTYTTKAALLVRCSPFSWPVDLSCCIRITGSLSKMCFSHNIFCADSTWAFVDISCTGNSFIISENGKIVCIILCLSDIWLGNRNGAFAHLSVNALWNVTDAVPTSF